MRVVLDTNVVVSAAFFGGPPRAVLDAWADGRLHVIISPSIFDEYLRVCDRLRAAYPEADYRAVLTALLAHGTLVPDADEDEQITAIPMTTSSCAAHSQPTRWSYRETVICLTPTAGTAFA